MKNSKWIAAVAALTLSATLAVAGPHGEGHGGKGGHRGEFGAKFAEKLGLSDAQKTQIKAIKTETREQNKSFFENAHQTRQDFRAARQAGDTAKAESLKATMESQHAQMKQIRDAEKQRVLSILTPAQRTQWEQLKAERATRHEGKRNQQ